MEERLKLQDKTSKQSILLRKLYHLNWDFSLFVSRLNLTLQPFFRDLDCPHIKFPNCNLSWSSLLPVRKLPSSMGIFTLQEHFPKSLYLHIFYDNPGFYEEFVGGQRKSKIFNSFIKGKHTTLTLGSCLFPFRSCCR